MHERFGRQWEENWQLSKHGGLHPYPDEYYLLQRKEIYNERRCWKGNLAHWEHDGYGYFVTLQQDTGCGKWYLVRTDLQEYYSVCYTFVSDEQMNDHIKQHGWRPYEQLKLELEV